METHLPVDTAPHGDRIHQHDPSVPSQPIASDSTMGGGQEGKGGGNETTSAGGNSGGGTGGGNPNTEVLLERLKDYLGSLGGESLDPGWMVEAKPRASHNLSGGIHTDVYYICPAVSDDRPVGKELSRHEEIKCHAVVERVVYCLAISDSFLLCLMTHVFIPGKEVSEPD